MQMNGAHQHCVVWQPNWYHLKYMEFVSGGIGFKFWPNSLLAIWPSSSFPSLAVKCNNRIYVLGVSVKVNNNNYAQRLYSYLS